MTFPTTFVTSLTDINITQYESVLGQVREGSDKRWYKYVKFTGSTTIAVGDVVCYIAADATQTQVDGANTNVAAGVAMAAVPSGTVQYGWIQIKGLATLSTALAGSPAVGDELTTNGASSPAVTKKTAANYQTVGITLIVASKVILADFPW